MKIFNCLSLLLLITLLGTVAIAQQQADSLQTNVTQLVSDIGIRATRLADNEGAEIVVPNGTILSGNLIKLDP